MGYLVKQSLSIEVVAILHHRTEHVVYRMFYPAHQRTALGSGALGSAEPYYCLSSQQLLAQSLGKRVLPAYE